MDMSSGKVIPWHVASSTAPTARKALPQLMAVGQGLPDREPGLRQRVAHALQAGRGPVVVADRLGDHAEPPMAEVHEMPGQQTHGAAVVGADGPAPGARIMVEGVDERDVVPL
jgi:hypothetical protein